MKSPVSSQKLSPLRYERIAFVSCPTGAYCREDRCQSYFDAELIPSMRAPMEDCEGAAGVLRAGGRALIIDAPAERLSSAEFTKRLLDFVPDVISFSVTFGSLDEDLRWIETIKARAPKALCLVRGAPAYVWADAILERSAAVDGCVRGDYELIFEQITRFGVEVVTSTVTRDRALAACTAPLQAANLDTLPFSDRSTIKPELYRVRGTRRSQATIHVQRGCPFPCTFCLVHTVSGKKARHRSPESIAQEINTVRATGVNDFYFRAETFSLDKEWTLAVCETLARECPGIRWVTATRVECVDEQIISAMAAAGCYGISFGVDVASVEIGKRVRKMPQREMAHNAMRLCDRHQILSLAYIMIGFVWDTPATVQEAKDFITSIKPDLVTVHFAHPYPGTPYYTAAAEAGLPVVSLKAQATPALALPTLTPKQLRAAGRRILLKHYCTSDRLRSLIKKRVLGPRGTLPNREVIARSTPAVALKTAV